MGKLWHSPTHQPLTPRQAPRPGSTQRRPGRRRPLRRKQWTPSRKSPLGMEAYGPARRPKKKRSAKVLAARAASYSLDRPAAPLVRCNGGPSTSRTSSPPPSRGLKVFVWIQHLRSGTARSRPVDLPDAFARGSRSSTPKPRERKYPPVQAYYGPSAGCILRTPPHVHAPSGSASSPYPWHLAVFAPSPTPSPRCIATTSSCPSACPIEC